LVRFAPDSRIAEAVLELRPRRSLFQRSLRGESRAAGEGDVGAVVTSLAVLRSRNGFAFCLHHAARGLSSL
jgi:hypothetical protein